MNITILSYFRNSSDTIERYFDQIYALKDLLWKKDHVLNLVLGYGDSRDKTGELLFEKTAYELGTILMEYNHGGPEFDSIVDPKRFRQLAFVANNLRQCVSKESDTVIWLESDLIWDPLVLFALIHKSAFLPVVSPLIFHVEPENKFYDTFAFRRNGVQFTNDPPYHQDLNGELLKMDSVGSCVVMQGGVFRQVIIPEEDVIVGMCRQVTDLGYKIYCDPSLKVYHP